MPSLLDSSADALKLRGVGAVVVVWGRFKVTWGNKSSSMRVFVELGMGAWGRAEIVPGA
jgi:hypothetical protein